MFPENSLLSSKAIFQTASWISYHLPLLLPKKELPCCISQKPRTCSLISLLSLPKSNPSLNPTNFTSYISLENCPVPAVVQIPQSSLLIALTQVVYLYLSLLLSVHATEPEGSSHSPTRPPPTSPIKNIQWLPIILTVRFLHLYPPPAASCTRLSFISSVLATVASFCLLVICHRAPAHAVLDGIFCLPLLT